MENGGLRCPLIYFSVQLKLRGEAAELGDAYALKRKNRPVIFITSVFFFLLAH